MPFTLNGIGTTYYGAREWAEDGSCVTTLFFVVFAVPIIPHGFVPSLSDRKAKAFHDCQFAELQNPQDTAALETSRKRLLRHNRPDWSTGFILLGLHAPLELVHEILG